MADLKVDKYELNTHAIGAGSANLYSCSGVNLSPLPETVEKRIKETLSIALKTFLSTDINAMT